MPGVVIQLVAVGLLGLAWSIGQAQVPELPPIGTRDPSKSPADSPSAPPLPPVGQAPRPAPPASTSPVTGKLGEPRAAESLDPRTVSDPELALVERVLAARREYFSALRELRQHYQAVGDRRKEQWVEEELRGFTRSAHPAYRLELDVPSPALRPSRDIREANDLFRQAMSYKDRGVGPEYHDNQRRAELLLQELLTRYPESTRIAEAAYELGELYESRTFRQFERAAAYYERSVQWNPTTRTDARLRIARIYDRELRDRARAIEWYRQVFENDPSPSRRQEALRRLNEWNIR